MLDAEISAKLVELMLPRGRALAQAKLSYSPFIGQDLW